MDNVVLKRKFKAFICFFIRKFLLGNVIGIGVDYRLIVRALILCLYERSDVFFKRHWARRFAFFMCREKVNVFWRRFILFRELKSDLNSLNSYSSKIKLRRFRLLSRTHMIVYIRGSFNNMFLTATFFNGNVVCNQSKGSGFVRTSAFKYNKFQLKSPFINEKEGYIFGKKLYSMGYRFIIVCFRGIFSYKFFSVVRGLRSSGLLVSSVFERLPKAHGGGVRSKKHRK